MYNTDILFFLILLLSDGNVTAIITGIFGVVTLLLTLVVIPLLNRILVAQKSNHAALTALATMKTELIEATKALGEAMGYAKGRLEAVNEDEKQKEQINQNTQKIIDAVKNVGKLVNK